jgi:hypothetical protein
MICTGSDVAGGKELAGVRPACRGCLINRAILVFVSAVRQLRNPVSVFGRLEAFPSPYIRAREASLFLQNPRQYNEVIFVWRCDGH